MTDGQKKLLVGFACGFVIGNGINYMNNRDSKTYVKIPIWIAPLAAAVGIWAFVSQKD